VEQIEFVRADKRRRTAPASKCHYQPLTSNTTRPRVLPWSETRALKKSSLLHLGRHDRERERIMHMHRIHKKKRRGLACNLWTGTRAPSRQGRRVISGVGPMLIRCLLSCCDWWGARQIDFKLPPPDDKIKIAVVCSQWNFHFSLLASQFPLMTCSLGAWSGNWEWHSCCCVWATEWILSDPLLYVVHLLNHDQKTPWIN